MGRSKLLEMSRILYYLIIKPISYLPFSVLYYLSDLLYFIGYRLVGYRKKVVRSNLQNSFPEKSHAEILQIEKKFYQHFCDLIIESIRLFTLPEKDALARFRVRNPELLQRFYREGKSIIVVAGHYNNWEWAAVALDPQIPHQVAGIYFPLANKFINEKFQRSRRRLGLELIKNTEVKQAFKANADRLMCVLFATDQSPSAAKKAYWTHFLNQETAVFFGAEKYAKDYNQPVIYGRIIKLKRGWYEMEFEVVAEDPGKTTHGEITERHTRLLEADIQKNPEFWLWTHRRWKMKREEEAVQMKSENEK